MVSLTKPPTIYMAGTLNAWANHPDLMERARLNENGPEQTFGWISPSWSMWQLHERRRDAGPAEQYDAEYDGDLSDWLADKIAWHIGGIDSVNDNTIYAADAYTDVRHDEQVDTDDNMSLSLIVQHVDNDTLVDALHKLQRQQGHQFLYCCRPSETVCTGCRLCGSECDADGNGGPNGPCNFTDDGVHVVVTH